MKAQDIFQVALTEVLKMGLRLLSAYSRAERMTADEARQEAAQIMRDVQLDEAVERNQFERLRITEPPPSDDSKG